MDLPAPGDWARLPGWELFSGTLVYRTEFTLSAAQAQQARFLDLGQVGDIAEASLNGRPQDVRAWAPYVLPVDGLVEGRNQLEVRVTNSMANNCYGMQLPSGLLGAVTLMSSR